MESLPKEAAAFRKNDDSHSAYYSVIRRVDQTSVEDQHRWKLGWLSPEKVADYYNLAYMHVKQTGEQVLITRGKIPIAWLKSVRHGNRVGMRMNRVMINNDESSALAMAAMSRQRPAVRI